MTVAELLTIGGALLSGGVAFGGVAMLVRKTDAKLEQHVERDDKFSREIIDRLARIETILTERK